MTGRETPEARAARERRIDVRMAREALADYDAGPPEGADGVDLTIWRARHLGALSAWVRILVDDLAAVDAEDGAR